MKQLEIKSIEPQTAVKYVTLIYIYVGTLRFIDLLDTKLSSYSFFQNLGMYVVMIFAALLSAFVFTYLACFLYKWITHRWKGITLEFSEVLKDENQ